jgi:hypothetical protein
MMTTDGKAIANVYKTMSAQSGATFTNSATANNLTLYPLNPLNFREDIVRLDYRINDKHSLYGRWLQDANSLLDPFGTFSSSNLNTTPTNRSGRELPLAGSWVISPHIINEVRQLHWVSQHIHRPATRQRSTWLHVPAALSGWLVP